MTPLEEAIARTIREWVWTRRHNGNSELIGADQAAKRIALLPEIVKMQEALKQLLSTVEADHRVKRGDYAAARKQAREALQSLKKEAE